MKSKIGIKAIDIFSSTNTIPVKKELVPEAKQESKSISMKAADKAVKSTVTFLNRHIVYLDRLSADIRSHSMAIVDRGAIIRAMINALENSNIDLNRANSEEEVKNIILEHLKIKNNGHEKLI